MSRSKFPHIFLKGQQTRHDYTSPQAGGGSRNIPSRNDRISHGKKLKHTFNQLWDKAEKENNSSKAQGFSSREGVYLGFRSKANYDLVTKSLEDLRQGIRLLNISTIRENGKHITQAIIYIPYKKVSWFLKKIEDYLDVSKDGNNKAKNQDLIFSIENINEVLLESFWQDKKELMPKDNQEVSCEVWLREGINDQDKGSSRKSFFEICNKLQIFCAPKQIIYFPERAVVLIKANKEQLEELIKKSDHIAEFRRVKETAKFWLDTENSEQVEWVKNLKQRLNVEPDSQVSICVLDTGINNGHDLIAPVLSDKDCHTVDSDWGVDDKNGHGTLMAGLSIYGNLQNALESSDKVNIKHKLESVKLIPKSGKDNPEHLYGYRTKQAVSLAEIEKPNNKRSICMAITSDDFRQGGHPSSWSGAVDQLTSGAEDTIKRLFFISVGNVSSEDWKNYPNSNLTSQVHDPAQSWNALAIGAYTNKDMINDSELTNSYNPIAQAGELSPFSTTSSSWDDKWPIKPDVVFEGGNIGQNKDDGFVSDHEDLSLLSLHNKPQEKQFEMFNATSAATAQAAWFSSQIQARYPNIWPETIRALMIHSAEWTEQMISQFRNPDKSDKINYKNTLRVFGYGLPNLESALSSYQNSLTLIAEQDIQPFIKKTGQNRCSTKDMHFYKMPWPKEALNSLPDDTRVKLKFTLSYFIEPGPGEIGWKDRYRYPSHGLRFSLCSPRENEKEFKKRINKELRDEDTPNSYTDIRWTLGKKNRDIGSIHSDTWEGAVQEISECNLMAITPITGWWKERSYLKKHDKKSRYSLIVSISTESMNVDIYTPTLALIKSKITAKT